MKSNNAPIKQVSAHHVLRHSSFCKHNHDGVSDGDCEKPASHDDGLHTNGGLWKIQRKKLVGACDYINGAEARKYLISIIQFLGFRILFLALARRKQMNKTERQFLSKLNMCSNQQV